MMEKLRVIILILLGWEFHSTSTVDKFGTVKEDMKKEGKETRVEKFGFGLIGKRNGRIRKYKYKIFKGYSLWIR